MKHSAIFAHSDLTDVLMLIYLESYRLAVADVCGVSTVAITTWSTLTFKIIVGMKRKG